MAEKLKAELARAGYGAASRLARHLEISAQRLWNYANGRNEVPDDIIGDMADFFGLTVEQFLGTKPRPKPTTNVVRELSNPMYPVGFAPIALKLMESVPCGNWADPADTVDMVEVEAKFEHPQRFAARIIGNSCFPILQQGDLAIFHSDTNPAYGVIVLARRRGDNAVTVKRLAFEDRGNRAKLEAVNPEFSVDDAEEWDVIARLVGIVRNQDDGTEASFYNPRGIRR